MGHTPVGLSDPIDNLPARVLNTTPAPSDAGVVVRVLGQIVASIDSGTIYNGTTALTPKFAFVNVPPGSTDAAVVAAVASKKIRVLALAFVAGAVATTASFGSKPAGASTALSATFQNGPNGGAVLPFSQVGWFETAPGQGLSVTTGAGASTGIQLVYAEV